MTGKDLWTLFDEECRKTGTEALLFGTGDWPSGRKRNGEPPEDLTLWDTIAARLDRNVIEAIVDTMKKQQNGLRHG